MADNVQIATGIYAASDDIGGVQYQRVKTTWGADGTATDVSAAAPLPVEVIELPTVTLTTVTGTVATSGDNTIIAAPSAGTRIVVHLLKYQLEAATATNVIVKNGSTAIDRTYCAQGQGYVEQPASGKEIRLADAAALVLNLSGANSVGYRVRYTTEAV